MVGWKRANSPLDNQHFLRYNYNKMTTKNEQIKFVPTERRDIKPAESMTSVIGGNTDSKSRSVKQEAPHFNEG